MEKSIVSGERHVARAANLVLVLLAVMIWAQNALGDDALPFEVKKLSADTAVLKQDWQQRGIDTPTLIRRLDQISLAVQLLKSATPASGRQSSGTFATKPKDRTITFGKAPAVAPEERETLFRERQADTLATHKPDTRNENEKADTRFRALTPPEVRYIDRLEQACSQLRRAVASGAPRETLDSLVAALPNFD